MMLSIRPRGEHNLQSEVSWACTRNRQQAVKRRLSQAKLHAQWAAAVNVGKGLLELQLQMPCNKW